MMATLEDLLILNNEQLLSASFNLVDKAATKELTDCFENIFKESIIKYILKNVIKHEIQQVSDPHIDDWKRVSLINKIRKLIPQPNLTTLTLTPKIPKTHLCPSFHSCDSTNSNIQTHVDKYETSTDYLLLSGYIRTEMNIKNNNNFPKDILSICQYFISDCSNINNQQLIVFNHTKNKYKSVFNDEYKFNMKTISNNTELTSKLVSTDIKKTKLISPYKVLFYDDKNCWVCDKFVHYPYATDIAANVQQIGHFEYGNKTKLPSDTFANKSLCGVVQYLDINNKKLLNFGGIEKDNYAHIYDSPSYVAQKHVYTFDLHNKLSANIKQSETFKTEQAAAQVVPYVKKLQSAPIYISTADKPAGSQLHFSSMMTAADTFNSLSPRGSPRGALPIHTSWKRTHPLLFARGYMSLCQVTNSKLALLGGEIYTVPETKYSATHHYKYGSGSGSNLMSYQAFNPSVVDHVELYDLNGKEPQNIPIKNLNHGRKECGSYYNENTQEMIVFGGNSGNTNSHTYIDSSLSLHANEEFDVSNSMEIYDFHKNTWIDVPYPSRKHYTKYPSVWTIGSKCIFVANIDWTINVQCEWIDLRVCDKNGKNKSKWNSMQSMQLNFFNQLNQESPSDNYTLFMQ